MLKELGKRLRSLRGEHSRFDYAAALGTSASSLVRWERGERPPDIEFLSKVAKLHEVSIDWLFYGDSEPPTSAELGQGKKAQSTVNIDINGQGKPPTSVVPPSVGEEITLLAGQVREMVGLLMEAGREVQRLTQENAELKIEIVKLKSAAEQTPFTPAPSVPGAQATEPPASDPLARYRGRMAPGTDEAQYGPLPKK